MKEDAEYSFFPIDEVYDWVKELEESHRVSSKEPCKTGKINEGKRADVMQEGMKMSDHKDKWYEPYKIMTTLGKGETKKRIESKIALGSSIPLEDCLFYGEKIDSEKYRLYISPHKMPPHRGTYNPYLPRVVLEIIADFDGHNTTFFWIKPRKFWYWIHLFFFTSVCIEIRVNILVYTFFLCLGVFLMGKYWEFIRGRVGEWLEELLGVKKETEE